MYYFIDYFVILLTTKLSRFVSVSFARGIANGIVLLAFALALLGVCIIS